MLGYFPEPYPDELFYSLCSRFQERMQYSSSKALLEEFFGTITVGPVVDFPTHLEYFVSILPPGNSYTVDSLIDDHTLLPFYGAFLEAGQLADVRSKMCQQVKGGIYPRSWAIARPVSLPHSLRFCPVCSQQDREEKGEFYWHRLHQVPGVEVCPTHYTWLELTDVSITSRRHKRDEFISAQQAIRLTPARPLDLSNPCHTELIAIALDAAWLLKQHQLAPGLQSLHKRYLISLINNDFAWYSGNLKLEKLVSFFRKHYPPELLERLNCTIEHDVGQNWLTRLVQRKKEQFKSSILHLLLIHFLGHSAESFFALSDELKPFGEGPWPCLNPVCAQYLKPCIDNCQIEYKASSSGRPTGIFSCTCGFVYKRIGPDKSPSDVTRYTKVLLYGCEWETTLRKLWDEPGLRISEIARRLHVCRATVSLHADRLNLPFPRPNHPRNRRRKLPLKNYGCHSMDAEILTTDVKKTKRTAWLKALEENPDANITELKAKLPDEFGWLSRHDRTWFSAHKPAPRRHVAVTVDWLNRDASYLEKAQTGVSLLRNTPGRPIRITTSTIAKSMELSAVYIRLNLDKMPLTAAFLDSVSETPEMIALRRIQWVAECYQQEGACPSYRQLIRRAGMSNAMALKVPVQHAINAALQALQQCSR